ncbi:MAG: hypothetical protein JW924_07805 [Fusobacteriaceae bacterium]|nr:hypothetical protein [Fusobacteriaceae bacterium]
MNRTLQRAFNILKFISSKKNGCTKKDISLFLNIPISSLNDILKTLLFLELIEIQNNYFFISIESYNIGIHYLKKNYYDFIAEKLEKLSTLLESTVFFAKENNDAIVYLLKFESSKSKIVTQSAGEREDFFSSAIGRSLYEFSSLKEKSDIFFKNKIQFKVCNRDGINFIIDEKNSKDYIFSVATSIFNERKEVIGAISTSHLYVDDLNKEKIIENLILTSKEISNNIGYIK